MSELAKSKQKGDFKIDLIDIARDVIKDWWLIILMGITAAMCSYIVANAVYKPAYTANATFVVSSKGSNDAYYNLAAASSVAESLTKIFNSDFIKKKVAMDIGTNLIPDYIKAEAIPETNLFVLKVSAPSPKIAYKIITSIINNYTTVTNNVFKNTILDILEAPKVPAYPDNPQNVRNIAMLAFWIGLAAMLALLAGLSIMRDNVKNEKEVTEKLDTNLFGVIYHENKYKTLRSRLNKKKKSIVITSPTVSFSFVESFKKIRAKYEYKASQKSLKVLLVTSVLENEGKSTVAANLALSLAQKSKKVLLIDADFSKPSIYKILQKDVKEEQEIGDFILHKGDLKEALTFDEASGLYLLIGSKLYRDSTKHYSGDSFNNLINVTKKVMDYIIIDAPPITVSADTEILADIADASLLIVKQSTARTKDINDAIDVLAECNSELLGCVYNNVRNSLISNREGYGHKYSYKGYYGKYYRTYNLKKQI